MATATISLNPPTRNPGGTLYRYLAREMVFPTIFTLAGLTLVVLTKDLLGFSDLVINRGFGAGVVASIAFYKTVPLASQMLPFATLVGSLVGLGRLGADRELLVLEACGLSGQRLLPPVLLFALVVTGIGLTLSLVGAPWANRARDAAFAEIARQNPTATVRAGVVQRFGDWRLEAREVSSRGDRMRSVLLLVPEVGETIFAEKGLLITSEGKTEIELENGVVLLDPSDKPRQLRFEKLRTQLPIGDDPLLAEQSDALGGAHLAQLTALARGPREPGSESQQAALELHRRFSLPLATLIFGFLVVPLFLSRAHFSRAGGGILGVAVIVFYYGLVQAGNGLIQAQVLIAEWGVWLPNLLLLVVALLLALRLSRMSAFGRHSDRPLSFGLRFSPLYRGLQHRLGSWLRRTRKVDPAESRASRGSIYGHRWSLQRYIAGRFLQMLLMCFSVLLVAYLLVDVLERLQWFARYNATGGEVVRFYAVRIPLLASRVIPMALLVSTALTVGLLAVQGELMGMRSCGIPAPRALLPVLMLCGLIAPAYFLLNNEVVPRTNAMADYLKTTEIKENQQEWVSLREPGVHARKTLWHRVAHRLYEAERMDPLFGIARHITIYEIAADGLPVVRTDARTARHIGGGVWRLRDPRRLEIGSDALRSVPSPLFAELGEELPAQVDTMHLSLGELANEIREVEASGYDATPYRVDYFVKLAAPIACLVLPALALFFAVGGPPYPNSALTLMLSAAVAVSYVLLTGVGASLGYGGALPPIVAGLAPTGLFAALAAYLGLRLRGFGQSF